MKSSVSAGMILKVISAVHSKNYEMIKTFFDITLACDDEQIQSHKVILAACSPFFRNILRRNVHQHPLLYLKGVKYSDLQSVLNFMYHGEVNIAQEELNSFLAVAEDLRVKGLTQSHSGEVKKVQNTEYPTSKPYKPPKPLVRTDQESLPPTAPRARPAPTVPVSYPPAVPDDDDIQEVVPIKSEPRDAQPPAPSYNSQPASSYTTQPAPAPTYTTQPAPTPAYSSHQPVALQEVEEHAVETYEEEVYDDYGQYGDQQYEDMDASISQQGYQATQDTGKGKSKHGEVSCPEDLYRFCMKEPGQSKWRCGVCNEYTNIGRNHVRNHCESKHFPNTFEYQCPLCDKICSTKKGLDVHKSEKHRTFLNVSQA